MPATRFGLWLGTKLGLAIAAVVLTTTVAPVSAQPAYPARPLTIVVPAAAGGPTDAMARLIGETMGRSLGQQIVVENAGGAAGTIGMARVARAAADGYTLAVWHIAHAIAPALYDNLRYNVIDDFDSIGRIADVPMTIIGKASFEPKSIADLIAWVKQRQTAVTYGHAGIGSASHLCSLMFMDALRIKMTALSYRGTGPAMTDLLGGQFDMMCDQTTTTTNLIKEGKIKGYAATTRTRLAVLPDLPTLAESGLKDFEVTAWHAMWAPKGLPADVATKLNAALQAALKDPRVIERLATLGAEPVPMELATPAALKAHLTVEVAKWGPVIKAAGARGE
jgi:tripartite-type tricarboxylate transporter receptor subunit TctC